MAAQLRYRTLVHNIGRVYASPAEGRTDLLQAGLDEIVATQRPVSAKEWNTVGTDAERLLKVWVAKEGGAAANEAAAQIVDLLYELAAATEAPVLVVSEPAIASSDRIAHIPSSSAPDLEELSAIDNEEKSVHLLVESDDDDDDDDDDDVEAEEEGAEVEEETEEEVDGEGEAAEATEEIEEEGAAVSAEAEEVLEPDAEAEEEEAEEEEGMEVEQIFIRGRAYWHETNTHKLYAVAGEDDVGDEVGELVEGKPRFYAK